MLSSQLVIALLKVAKIKYIWVKGEHGLRFFVLNTRLNRNVFTDLQHRLTNPSAAVNVKNVYFIGSIISETMRFSSIQSEKTLIPFVQFPKLHT